MLGFGWAGRPGGSEGARRQVSDLQTYFLKEEIVNSSLARKLAVAALAIAIVLLPAASWAAGADTFKAKCVMCHGADGKGDTPMGKKNNVRDLGSAEVQKQTDAQLTDIITKGKNPPKMPAFEGKLTADEIKQLVAHLRSIKK